MRAGWGSRGPGSGGSSWAGDGFGDSRIQGWVGGLGTRGRIGGLEGPRLRGIIAGPGGGCRSRGAADGCGAGAGRGPAPLNPAARCRAARLPPLGHGAPAAVQAPEEAAAAAASSAAAERRAAGRPDPRRARRRESRPRAEYVSPRVAGPCAHPACWRTAPPLFLGGPASLPQPDSQAVPSLGGAG